MSRRFSHTPSAFSAGEPDGLLVEMNTTPLIDVMLVLLIMLIVTVPLSTHAVKLDMPAPVDVRTREVLPRIVTVGIDFDGTLLWDGEAIDGLSSLEARIHAIAARADQPEFHVRPHKLAPYRMVAAVLSRAQRMGLTKIGIVGGEQFMN